MVKKTVKKWSRGCKATSVVNSNKIITKGWSNGSSRLLYENEWPTEPHIYRSYYSGNQCGGCSFYAEFNQDWGLCCHKASRHYLETVFEHFTCPSFVDECWGPHSFSVNKEYHCYCGGGPPPDKKHKGK